MKSEKQKKHLERLAEMKRGKLSPIKGISRPPFSQKWKDNISKGRLGYKVPQEVRDKISKGHKGKPKSLEWRKQMSIRVKGSGNPQWKGGLSSLHQQIRNNPKYRQWRSDVFQRDNYICQICFNRGGCIEADHIKQMALIVKENLIDCVEKAIICEELWNINNGRTLCKQCHSKTETYGRPKNK